MKTIPCAVFAFASLAVATTVYAVGRDSLDETKAPAMGGPASAPMERALLAGPKSDYLPYSERGLATIAPGCKWVRMAIFDNEQHVIGWRGDPVGMCP
jgi:hypothetical protein